MSSSNEAPLVITRTFDAPVELVWQAWADPKQAVKWWGPKHWNITHYTADFRVGGNYLSCMKGPMPDGTVLEVWSTGKFLEIVPLRKIRMTDNFADEKGNVVPVSHYGMPDDGTAVELEITVSFKSVGGKTEMTLTHRGMSKTMQESAKIGWNEQFDKLVELLAT